MGSKFLIVLSYSRAFPMAVKNLQREFNIERIDVLKTADPFSLVEERELTDLTGCVGEILQLNTLRFEKSGLTEKLVQKINNKNYDGVVVLCRDADEAGYKNVEKLASKAAAGSKIFFIDTKGEIREKGFWTTLRKRIFIGVKCCREGMKIIFLLLVFIFIVVPMYGWHKITGIFSDRL